MKKAIVAILALLYITTASGVVVNIHYCMGHVSSVSYGYDKHAACDKCGMEQQQGCCHTELKVVKLQDEHQLAKATQQLAQAPAIIPVQTGVVTVPDLSAHQYLSLNYHSPPDNRVNEVYLHTLVFRI